MVVAAATVVEAAVVEAAATAEEANVEAMVAGEEAAATLAVAVAVAGMVHRQVMRAGDVRAVHNETKAVAAGRHAGAEVLVGIESARSRSRLAL